MSYSEKGVDDAQSVKNRILHACSSLLVPVARFLLRSGIGYREFDRVCRAAFVKVARDEFGIRGRPTNTSRIAAMTGLGRKEVSRLRGSLDRETIDQKAVLSPLSDVLQRWHCDPNYTDDEGEPLALPFSGSARSFSSLVKECARDVPAGAIRTELIRHGAVAHSDSGTMRPIRREIVPDAFDEKLISALSFSLASLAETVAHNSNPQRVEPGRIERCVQTDAISLGTREELRPVIRRRVEQFTRELDDLFGRYGGNGAAERTEQGQRIGVGIYYFEEEKSA